MSKYLLYACVLICPINYSYAESRSEHLLEEALKCDHSFETAEIIKSLQKEGVIGIKPINTFNGIPTYSVIKPTKIFGKDIKIIEGWSPNKMFSAGSGNENTYIAIGFGEPISVGQYSSYSTSLERAYPSCANKIGVRQNLESNYNIKKGDEVQHYLVHQCSVIGNGMITGDVEECKPGIN